MTSRTIGSAIWAFSGSWVQAFLRLAVVTVLARLLGPEDFGLAAAALIVIGFFRVFLRTGVRPALIQRAELEDRHVRTGFTVSLLIGVVFGALIVALAGSIAEYGFRMEGLAPVLQVVVLILPLQSLGIVASALLERDLRFRVFIRIEVVSYLLGYALLGPALALAGFGVWALVAAYVGQELLRTLMSLVARPHPMRVQLERRALRELFYFGGGFALARFGNFGALNGDKWVAGRWLGQEFLGLYKYAVELTDMIANLFGTVLDKVLFPAMARIQGDRVRLGQAYRTGVGMVAALVLPTSAAISVVAPELIHLVLGAEWEPVVAPFRVLAGALLIRAAYTMSDSLARATGAVYRRAWRQAVYAAAVIGFAWIGQHWGLVGMSLGVVLATTINLLLMADLSMRLAALTWRDVVASHFGALPLFGISLGTMAAVARVCRSAELPDFVVVLAASSATGAMLLLGLVVAPRLVLGPDAANAIRALISFGDARFAWIDRVPGMRSVRIRLAQKEVDGAGSSTGMP